MATGSKVRQYRDTTAAVATASSLAKKMRDSSIADSNRTCSNRRSRKNKHGNSISKSVGRVYTMQPSCNGCG